VVDQVLRVESTATLTLNGGLDMQPGSIDASNGGTVIINSGSNVNAGAFTTNPSNTVGNGAIGALIVNSGGTFSASNVISLGTDVPGNGYTNGMIRFAGGSGTINNVNIASADFRASSASLTISSGGVVNQTVGQLALAPGASATAVATLSISGAGSAYHFRAINHSIEIGGTGSGTVSVTSGGLLDVTSGLSVIGVNTHGVMIVDGGSVSSAGGVYVGGGSLSLGLSGGTVSVGSGAVLDVYSGGTFSVALGYTVSPNSSFYVLSNSRATFGLALNAAINNNATLSFSSIVNAGGSSTWGDGSVSFLSATFSGAANVTLGELNIATNGAGSSVSFTGGSLNIGSLGALTIGGGTSSKTALVSVNSATALLNAAGSVNLLARSKLMLQNGGSFIVGGNFSINSGTFDGTGGSFSFTAPSYVLDISNNGLFNAASLSTGGHTPTLSVHSGGKMILSGLLDARRANVSITDANSIVQASQLSCAGASITIGGGGVGSFGFVTLGDSLLGPNTITINSGGAITAGSLSNSLSGNIFINSSGAGTIAGTATNLGQIRVTGTLLVGGAMTNNGLLAVKGGVATLANVDGAGSASFIDSAAATANYLRQSAIEIGGPSTVTSAPNGTSAGVSRTSSLTFDDLSTANQRWDLMDNALIVDYSKTISDPIASIHDYLASGRDDGKWKGSGLTSTLASKASSSAHPTALGYAENFALGLTTFMGQSVDNTTLLVRYVYLGDANLDGRVNALDFNLLAANYGAASGKHWFMGDFDYDGFANSTDFSALAANFNQVLAGPALGTLIPEPDALALIAAALLADRRRRAVNSAEGDSL
jgi:hypothetical protein